MLIEITNLPQGRIPLRIKVDITFEDCTPKNKNLETHEEIIHPNSDEIQPKTALNIPDRKHVPIPDEMTNLSL